MCSWKVSTVIKARKYLDLSLTGSIIKPSFPLPGLKCVDRDKYKPEDIAFATATVVARAIPTSVPGVAFLSGGLEKNHNMSVFSSSHGV